MGSPDRRHEGVKYLVVEDSEDQLFVWRQLFRRAGMNARFCTTAQAALAHVSDGYVPDVLMSDFYLPDMTGVELMEAIRALAGPIRCLLVTGNRDDDALLAHLERTGIAIAYKPIKFDDLEKRLLELVDTMQLPKVGVGHAPHGGRSVAPDTTRNFAIRTP